jgi:hypothetical protein
MFFVSLLLNEMIAWMRTQPGTSSLRALLYMDEIVGFFPPVANPPSKPPLLTLLKQARAHGLGVVLATQNPVDLDYKGLSNAGTWFIGRLQTERDKARVLDGLEGAAAGGFNRSELEGVLSRLSTRIFLLHNVHERAPVVFETRWALSYLRGPLSRSEIRRLTEPQRAAAAEASTPGPAAAPGPPQPVAAGGGSSGDERPIVPPEIPQFFVNTGGNPGPVVYQPTIAGTVQVRFVGAKADIDVTRDTTYLAPVSDDAALPLDWENATEAAFSSADLDTAPLEHARYAPLPPAALRPKNYDAWRRELAGWVQRTQAIEVLKSTASGLVSRPGESERDFRIRLQQAAREARDRRRDQLRQKYAPKIAALLERERRAQQTLERETEQASSAKVQTAISVGATLLSAVLGRSALGGGTVGRATTSARGVSRSMKEAQDVARARDTLEAVRQQRADLEAELHAAVDTFDAGSDPAREPLQTISIKPKRADVAVRLVALVWTPRVSG